MKWLAQAEAQCLRTSILGIKLWYNAKCSKIYVHKQLWIAEQKISYVIVLYFYYLVGDPFPKWVIAVIVIGALFIIAVGVICARVYLNKRSKETN